MTSEMAGLNIIDGLTHISISDEEQRFECLLGDSDSFSLDYSLQIEFHLIIFQLAESQDNASALYGLNDLR